MILETRALSKHFGGNVVFENIHLQVHQGEILGLIGPNGAGKSTLVNVITGFHRPNSGQVVFLGKDIGGLRPHAISKLGIARTFQESVLFGDLSCVDNVFTGFHNSYRCSLLTRHMRLPSARSEERSLRVAALEILSFMGLNGQADELACNLPHGHQRILSVCIALACGPQLLFLDEPVTGMNETEMESMSELIRKIQRSGVTVLLIEHHMGTVMSLCDRIVVLHNGGIIADGSPSAVQQDEAVIEAYLGKE